jgi:hypothetical protein
VTKKTKKTKKMMRKVFLISILVLGASMTLLPQAPPQKPPVPVPDEQAPVLTVPKDYRYSARGRRDPFVNPVPKPKTAVNAPPVVRPPGLKGVLITEAQIAGVVTSKEPAMNVVIIAAPGAKTPYFARVGDQLYDAAVRKITMETVTFVLTTTPAGDAGTPREIVRKVRPKPGDEK